MLKTVINCHLWNRGLQNQTEKVPCTVLLNYLHTFVFNIFSVLIFFIYIINIRYWQVLFITQEQLGKSQFATSSFKCWESTAAVLVTFDVNPLITMVTIDCFMLNPLITMVTADCFVLIKNTFFQTEQGQQLINIRLL